ncbi:MAG: aldolase/citrate lyase family protein [Rhodoluna sp.]|nr:aldolase/citrate lyase family protein [Rhodoluna sp.]
MTSPLDNGNIVKRFKNGELTIGTFLGLASPLAAEVAAVSGVDWVLLDLEHGGGGEEQLSPTVLASGAYGIPTLVRVESAERIRIGRALDAGAAGVMVPRLESAEQVSKALSHFAYPPFGDRGVASYNRAAAWGLNPKALESAKKAAAIIQIETLGALAEVDEIASIEGVDVLFVGPLDLSYALGMPGDFKNPAFIEALKKVVSAANRFGKIPGILSANSETARGHIELGFKFIALSSDSVLLSRSIIENLEKVRGK